MKEEEEVMVSFLEWLTNWESIGVFNVLMPFLLIFTLTFAVLEKVRILGDGKRNLNLVVSLVLALLFVRNQALVTLLNSFLPNISIFMVVALMFLLLVGLWMGDQPGLNKSLLGLASIVSLIFILWAVFSNVAGDWFNFLPDWIRYMDGDTKAMIIFIGLFVLLVWWLSKGDKVEGAGDGEKLLAKFGKGFGRGKD